MQSVTYPTQDRTRGQAPLGRRGQHRDGQTALACLDVNPTFRARDAGRVARAIAGPWDAIGEGPRAAPPKKEATRAGGLGSDSMAAGGLRRALSPLRPRPWILNSAGEQHALRVRRVGLGRVVPAGGYGGGPCAT